MQVEYGTYTVRDGDTPRTVALSLYGNEQRVGWLLEANPGAQWVEGEKIVVPNKRGEEALVKKGDSMQTLLQRMFPGKPVHIYFNQFLKWNGPTSMPGDVVFVPETQKSQY